MISSWDGLVKMIKLALIEIGSRRTRTLSAALADAGVEILCVQGLRETDPAQLGSLGADACLIAAESPALQALDQLRALKEQSRCVVLAVLPEDDHALQAGLLDLAINAYVVESISPALLRTILEACIRRYRDEAGLTQALLGTQAELEKRRVVDRARCLLMERHGLSEKDAYRQLQASAMQRGLPMAELARQVLQDAVN